jgi:ATP-dependent Clp protease ATP-binding subunit ClpC
MFSNVIKSALEREVVGQPAAVNSIVRGVTRVMSGLTPRERTLCAYMLMGPTGTGKTHLVQSLARFLHGAERRVVVADCSYSVTGDPWMAFVAQLAPLFAAPPSGAPGAPGTPRMPGMSGMPGMPGMSGMPGAPGMPGPPPGMQASPPRSPQPASPMSILLVEYLERGSDVLFRGLAAALETGQVMLPNGQVGKLDNCLIFLTTGLCSREILDQAPGIGFSGAQDEQEDAGHDRVYELCLERAEKHFGANLMGRLDRLVIFHRLDEQHLAAILERRIARLNQWLAPRGPRVEIDDKAREFLLERGQRRLKTGSRDLVRACQNFVEFPLADLLVSDGIPRAAQIVVTRQPDEEHLHFSVSEPPDVEALDSALLTRVPVTG